MLFLYGNHDACPICGSSGRWELIVCCLFVVGSTATAEVYKVGRLEGFELLYV